MVGKCQLCGGKAELYVTRNGLYGSSAFIGCTQCGVKTSPVWLGTEGEKGMIKEVEKKWNRNILRDKVESLKSVNKTLKRRIDIWEMTEADYLGECYEEGAYDE